MIRFEYDHDVGWYPSRTPGHIIAEAVGGVDGTLKFAIVLAAVAAARTGEDVEFPKDIPQELLRLYDAVYSNERAQLIG